ncbi:hypothetical protein EON63_12665, partial [archaeon]
MRLLLLLLLLLVLVRAQDRVWTRIAGSAGNDFGFGVSVDHTTQSVFVTGVSRGSIHGEPYVAVNDMILIKYATNGTRLWTRMVGETSNEFGYGVAVDTGTGYVYVTGVVQESIHGEVSAGSNDIVLLKYAANGTRVWTRMVGTNGDDFGYGVAVNIISGDVYVTGQVGDTIHGEPYAGSTSDIVLLKYAGNGTRLWTRVTGTGGIEIGYGVAVDTSTGYVYVSGYAAASMHGEPYVGGWDMVLMKFASNGTRIWTRMVGTLSNDIGNAVAVDTSAGDVYVTGQTAGSLHGEPYVASVDMFLIKYASNGTRVWTRMAGSSTTDIGRGISVDSNTSAVYVTGFAQGSIHGQTYVSGNDILMMKYASNGTRMWTRMVGTSGSDLGLGVSVDSSTSVVYFVGGVGGSIDNETFVSGSDIITMCYTKLLPPTGQPTTQPTNQPSGHPSGQPSGHPSCQPTGHPSGQP